MMMSSSQSSLAVIVFIGYRAEFNLLIHENMMNPASLREGATLISNVNPLKHGMSQSVTKQVRTNERLISVP